MGKAVHRLQLCPIYSCGRLKLCTIGHIVNLYSYSPRKAVTVVCFLACLEGFEASTPAQKAAAALDMIRKEFVVSLEFAPYSPATDKTARCLRKTGTMLDVPFR